MKKLKRFFSTVGQGTCASLLTCSLVLMGTSATAFAYATENSADHHHVTTLTADECSSLGHTAVGGRSEVLADIPDGDHHTIVYYCGRCGAERERTAQLHGSGAPIYEECNSDMHTKTIRCPTCSEIVDWDFEDHTGDGNYTFEAWPGAGFHTRRDKCTKCGDYRAVDVDCTGDGSYRFKYKGNGTHLRASKCKYCNVRFNHTVVKCTYKKGAKVCKYCDNKKRWHK